MPSWHSWDQKVSQTSLRMHNLSYGTVLCDACGTSSHRNLRGWLLLPLRSNGQQRHRARHFASRSSGFRAVPSWILVRGRHTFANPVLCGEHLPDPGWCWQHVPNPLPSWNIHQHRRSYSMPTVPCRIPLQSWRCRRLFPWNILRSEWNVRLC